ncbi:polyprenyl synthetase family protein [Streptacidiphilus sp. EB103A]|uniref:polyprenyl synthetase family protein n=1 Tax=Streptacidiphilus sp. EB103A TaxID=3156275 RepID=UPI003515C4C5
MGQGRHPCDARAGKALRPALALAAARATGEEDPGPVRPAAAALELLRVFTLLHDDVMDKDPVRRHRSAA